MGLVNNISPDGVVSAPEWMVSFVEFRRRLFLQTVEPVIVLLLGPVVQNNNDDNNAVTEQLNSAYGSVLQYPCIHCDETHRRLDFLPSYVSNVNAFKDTSMSFATLIMMYVTLTCLFLIFLSCFYHNQKTSPLFISPRRHRLPKLVPPPLPVDGYFSWVKVCLYLSDEEVIDRIGYDALIFLRFHRLALRCIVKMSIFSFIVLLPLNFTGGGHAKTQDLKEYVGFLLFTDFLRFTMANVQPGAPRLWVHCFAAYLLTGIVVRELIKEYEAFTSIRHRYLLSREPHLRAVIVTNIPRHLRSASKISSYFKHVYPNAVKSVHMCQNLIQLQRLVDQRSKVLAQIENELLVLCRKEKQKLYENTMLARLCFLTSQLEDCGVVDGTQERLAKLYTKLEKYNESVEQEQRRRTRVMRMLDRMEAGEGARDIDYVLASPYVSDNDPEQRKTLGLSDSYNPREADIPETIVETDETDISNVHTGGDVLTENTTGQSSTHLRSRSPVSTVVNQDAVEMQPDSKKKLGKKMKKPFVSAKRAIRRYSRITNQNLNLLGRPIRSSGDGRNEARIEDHINEVTDKAFVIMRTYTAATIAIQSMHSSKPGSMQVATAPEPRDVLWDNIYMSKGAQRTRSYVGEFFVLLIITFYVIPVALISLLVSEQALISSSPRLAQLDEASSFFAAAITLVQPLCLVSLQQLLPPLFIAIGEAEGRTSFSDVQMCAFSRYFLFQVLNVFLVTTVAGSIFETIAIIIEHPEVAFEMLGNSLPRLSSFFITFVTIKAFISLGMELVRIMSLGQAAVRCLLIPNATLRTKRSVVLGMRAIDDPGWFPFHKILAQDMLVVVISVVFAVVAPLVLLPCALFCLFSRIMWTHHHMYIYEGVFETGGQFWPKIFRRFVFGLIIAQMTITGQFFLKDAKHEAYATIVLIFMTYVFLRSTRARYDPASSALPLEVATVMDINLQNEKNEADRRNDVEQQEEEYDENRESYVGNHDPFTKAYVQPALRANPRARPEQPFPPAQLGRESYNFDSQSDESTDEGYQDSGATVRLKSLNQNDRKLIDQWWNEQIQLAGKQNTLDVLIGEACGTLTLSGANIGSQDHDSLAGSVRSVM